MLFFPIKSGLLLTLSCPGTRRATVNIGHSNFRPGSKELTSQLQFPLFLTNFGLQNMFFGLFLSYIRDALFMFLFCLDSPVLS